MKQNTVSLFAGFSFHLLWVLCAGIVVPQVSLAEASLKLEGLPGDLSVVNAAVSVRTEPNGMLLIESPGKTNLFNNPNGKSAVHSAPMVLFTPKGDFVLKARVEGQLKNVYDVAALVVYQNEVTWAKLCYENSVTKTPTIVSVVTRGVSDDCNSQTLTTGFAYLAIVRRGTVFTFHFSLDGKTWTMVRHFNLTATEDARVGFAAHCSRGDSFAATFSEISYTDKVPQNITDLNVQTK